MQVYKDFIELCPLSATFYGSYEVEDKYVHPATQEYRILLSSLINKYKNSSFKYDEVFFYLMRLEENALKYPFHQIPVNHFVNPFKDILDIIDRFEFNQTGKGFDSFVTRINKMISILPELQYNMNQGILDGIVQNKTVIGILIENLEHLDIKLDSIKRHKKKYKEFMNEAFLPAARKFAKSLKIDYLPYCKKTLGLYGFFSKDEQNSSAKSGTLTIQMYEHCLHYNVNYNISYQQVFKLGIKLVSLYDRAIKEILPGIDLNVKYNLFKY